MRRIERQITLSFTLHVLLLVILFFLATYFFIGKNIVYMSKTQNQINNEVLYYLSNALVDKAPGVKPDEVLELARGYNVGVSIRQGKENKTVQEINETAKILRLEFGGHLNTREIILKDGTTKVKLTYFRPYFADDDTVKFVPIFLRLFLLFTVFTLVFSLLISRISSGLITTDIKKLQGFIAALIKGSYKSFTGKINYSEFKEVIDDLNCLQAQILKKEELKKRMTADFAHELRTPLTTLQSHLEALIDGIWQPTTERFNSCHEEIMRLIRLVGDLEKLSKVEDENMVLQKSTFDFTALVRNIGTNFQGEMSQKNISLIINGDDQIIKADKDKISQIIVNVLSNSLKYTPRNGKILADISGDNQYLHFVLNDSGMGIPEIDLPNVFDRLYRSDSSRTRKTGGAGIGLTIAKAIVEAHNGSIDIVSQEGVGTEITIILPR